MWKFSSWKTTKLFLIDKWIVVLSFENCWLYASHIHSIKPIWLVPFHWNVCPFWTAHNAYFPFREWLYHNLDWSNYIVPDQNKTIGNSRNRFFLFSKIRRHRSNEKSADSVDRSSTVPNVRSVVDRPWQQWLTKKKRFLSQFLMNVTSYRRTKFDPPDWLTDRQISLSLFIEHDRKINFTSWPSFRDNQVTAFDPSVVDQLECHSTIELTMLIEDSIDMRTGLSLESIRLMLLISLSLTMPTNRPLMIITNTNNNSPSKLSVRFWQFFD